MPANHPRITTPAKQTTHLNTRAHRWQHRGARYPAGSVSATKTRPMLAGSRSRSFRSGGLPRLSTSSGRQSVCSRAHCECALGNEQALCRISTKALADHRTIRPSTALGSDAEQQSARPQGMVNRNRAMSDGGAARRSPGRRSHLWSARGCPLDGSGRLTDLDQVSVRISDIAADLGFEA